MATFRMHRQPRIAALITALLLAAEGRAAGSNSDEGTQGTDRRTGEEQCNEEPPQRRLVVSLADRKLAVLVNGEVTRLYDVAIGASRTPSPTGTFQVINRIPKPTWWGPNGVVPPGKRNPLGSRWIGSASAATGSTGPTTRAPSAKPHLTDVSGCETPTPKRCLSGSRPVTSWNWCGSRMNGSPGSCAPSRTRESAAPAAVGTGE